jgi:hypothetical protein
MCLYQKIYRLEAGLDGEDPDYPKANPSGDYCSMRRKRWWGMLFSFPFYFAAKKAI